LDLGLRPAALDPQDFLVGLVQGAAQLPLAGEHALAVLGQGGVHDGLLDLPAREDVLVLADLPPGELVLLVGAGLVQFHQPGVGAGVLAVLVEAVVVAGDGVPVLFQR